MPITTIPAQAGRPGFLHVCGFINVFIANPALQWSNFVTFRLMRPKPLYYRTDNNMLSVWNWEGVESGKTSRLGSLLNGQQSPNPVDIPATCYKIGRSNMSAGVPVSTGANGENRERRISVLSVFLVLRFHHAAGHPHRKVERLNHTARRPDRMGATLHQAAR